MQYVIERGNFLRRMPAIARLRAQPVHPANDALVELRMRPHRVEHLGAILEQARQDLVDVGDGKRVVGAEVARRPVRAGAPAVPGFARRIAIAHEKNVFALRAARHQHRHRFRLDETGEIEKIAVGAVRVFNVVVAHAHGRGGHDGNRIPAHLLEQCAAAAFEFFAPDRRHARHARRRSAGSELANGWTRHRAPAPRHARARAQRTATAHPRARTRPPRRTPTSFSSFSSSASTPTWVISVKSRMISPASIETLPGSRRGAGTEAIEKALAPLSSAHRRATPSGIRHRAAAARSRRRCRPACAPWSCRRSAAPELCSASSSGESSGRISRSHSIRP